MAMRVRGSGRVTVEKVPPLFAESEGSSSQRSLQFSWELKPRLGFANHEIVLHEYYFGNLEKARVGSSANLTMRPWRF